MNLPQPENPYASPVIQNVEQSKPNTGLVRILVYVGGTFALGFLLWIAQLMAFFGESTELWPGFACAIPAILGSGAVGYVLSRIRINTALLFVFYVVVDFVLFVSLIAYIIYWRLFGHVT